MKIINILNFKWNENFTYHDYSESFEVEEGEDIETKIKSVLAERFRMDDESLYKIQSNDDLGYFWVTVNRTTKFEIDVQTVLKHGNKYFKLEELNFDN